MAKKKKRVLEETYELIEKKLREFSADYFHKLHCRNDDDLFSVMATRYMVLPEEENDEDAVLAAGRGLVDGSNDLGIDTILFGADDEGNYCMYLGQGKHYHSSRTAEKDEIRSIIDKACDGAFHMLQMLRQKEPLCGNDRVKDVLRHAIDENEGEFESTAIEISAYFSCRGPSTSWIDELADRMCLSLKDKLSAEGIEDPSVKVRAYFRDDLAERIRTVEARHTQFVESGKIEGVGEACYVPGKTNGGESVGITWAASAKSLVDLYRLRESTLFVQNLRFHIRSKLDHEIQNTIRESPETFWAKNNGLTFVAEDARLDGKEMKLERFSIVNGCQTMWNLQKAFDPKGRDFYVPVKIVLVRDAEEARKNSFIKEVAQASNSQKVIKDVDLISVRQEQQALFAAFKLLRVTYLIKRGMKETLKGDDKKRAIELPATRGYALGGILLMPGSARSNPAKLLSRNGNNPLYSSIYSSDASVSDKLAQRFLDLDFAAKRFKEFREEFRKDPNLGNSKFSKNLLRIWENGRTYVFAFIGLAAYVMHGFKDEILSLSSEQERSSRTERLENLSRNSLKKFGGIFSEEARGDQDRLIKELSGYISECLECLCRYFQSRSETDVSNFLKTDDTFWELLDAWYDMGASGINSAIENHKWLFARG